MQRAKTIDELYEEVKDYDIVLTNDAPLETALNSRISTARVGTFAVTPRHLASRVFAAKVLREPMWNDLRVISKVSAETDLDIKYVHGEVENIRRIRKYTHEVERFLYSNSSRAVYRSYRAMPTLDAVMGAVDLDSPVLQEYFEGKTVAVIGVELFDSLDKRMCPEQADYVDIFAPDGGFELREVREAGNDRQVAENAVELIDPATADETAIVLDVNGPIADAVRAALYRRGLPFKNNMPVKDLYQVRDYLELLNASMEFSTIRVKHVRQLISAYGGSIDSKYNEYLVSRYMEAGRCTEKTATLLTVMRGIREMTFGEVCDQTVGPRHRPQVLMLLDSMDLKDMPVTERRVNEITYAVNNIKDLKHNEQIPDSEKRGVLIADCNNAMFIDKPLVIYLGMGQEWVRSIIGKDYIDREDQAERDAQAFTVLLQQGQHRIYIANSMKKGEPVRPCLTFEAVLNADKGAGEEPVHANTFADVFSEPPIRGPWYEPKPPERVERGSVSEGMWGGTFSKSSLNRYRNCPRQFMFGVVAPGEDKDSTVLGNMIHDFAEFYMCYPDEVSEKGLDKYVGIIADKCAGLIREETRPVEVCRIRLALDNIVRFLNGLNAFDSAELNVDIASKDESKRNIFAIEAGHTKTTDICEMQAMGRTVPLNGEFDLMAGGVVYDYKTGGSKTLSDIDKSLRDAGTYGFEMQPLVYLSIARDAIQDSVGEFRLFFTNDNDLNAARGIADVRNNMRTIVLEKRTREEMMEFILKLNFENTSTYSYLSGHWGALADLFKQKGVENAADWPDDPDLPDAIRGRFKGSKKDAVAAVKKASKLFSHPYFKVEDTLVVPRDSMDRFDEDVRRYHREASESYNGSFPAKPLIDCKRCEYFDICTMDAPDTREVDSDE